MDSLSLRSTFTEPVHLLACQHIFFSWSPFWHVNLIRMASTQIITLRAIYSGSNMGLRLLLFFQAITTFLFLRLYFTWL